jgi:hypothetical protein
MYAEQYTRVRALRRSQRERAAQVTRIFVAMKLFDEVGIFGILCWLSSHAERPR